LKTFWALYRAFYRLGQAKFSNGGSVLGSSQFSILPQPLKNDAWFKSGKHGLKNKQLASLI
jgi:hypothetical protein